MIGSSNLCMSVGGYKQIWRNTPSMSPSQQPSDGGTSAGQSEKPYRLPWQQQFVQWLSLILEGRLPPGRPPVNFCNSTQYDSYCLGFLSEFPLCDAQPRGHWLHPSMEGKVGLQPHFSLLLPAPPRFHTAHLLAPNPLTSITHQLCPPPPHAPSPSLTQTQKTPLLM